MPNVEDVLNELERIAPSRYAFSFDKIGLQIGDPEANVTRCIVSLDRSLGAVDFAVQRKAQLLLCHHPLIWEPMKAITNSTPAGQAALRLIRNGISFVAAHTNWDCAPGGINDALASKIGLRHVQPSGSRSAHSTLKLVVFCPDRDVERVVDAAAAARAGAIGLYRRCAFFSTGKGTFLPEEGANPTIGLTGQVEVTPETRVEMILPASERESVESAVRKAHSYETPAIDFYLLQDQPQHPISRIGELSRSIRLSDFAQHVEEKLNTRTLCWGDPNRAVQRVAVCGGAADEEWKQAQAAGADVLVTGEVKQHVGLEAAESGFALVQAGHYATEHPGCVALAKSLVKALPEIDFVVYEPEAGACGRPFHT